MRIKDVPELELTRAIQQGLSTIGRSTISAPVPAQLQASVRRKLETLEQSESYRSQNTVLQVNVVEVLRQILSVQPDDIGNQRPLDDGEEPGDDIGNRL